ncbi:MAG: hypothetical protein AB2L09_12755 [Coriobacteriia bacterium]
MTKDVYIIRRNSSESRLLSHVGFDRNALPVAEWRGRGRSHGGYGKSPVAWRVSGESDVRKLCEGILRILGSRPPEQLTAEDAKALDRARRTLVAFDNRARRSASSDRVKEDRAPLVLEFLRLRLPCASDVELDEVMSLVERIAPRSVADLLTCTNEALAGRPAVWQRACGEFVDAMSSAIYRP